MSKSEPRFQRQIRLSVDLGPTLAALLETMRREIQDTVGGGRSVSRGDVVRLAAKRLWLQMLCHHSEDPEKNENAVAEWLALAREIQDEGLCPYWLIPLEPLRQVAKPKPKKGGKK